LGTWEDYGSGYNIQTGFRSEVIKALANFGFVVVIEGKSYTVNNETGDINEEEVAELAEEDEGERIYGLDMFVRSPKESLSSNIRQFLATVQEYQVDQAGEVVEDESGTPKIRQTILGTPKYIDFNRVYSNLSSKLADSKDPYAKLGELAQQEPVTRAVYDRLTDELRQGNVRL